MSVIFKPGQVSDSLCASFSPSVNWSGKGLVVRAGGAPLVPLGPSLAWHTVGAPYTVVSVLFLFYQPMPSPGPLSPPAWQALWDRVSQRRRAETSGPHSCTPENLLAKCLLN